MDEFAHFLIGMAIHNLITCVFLGPMPPINPFQAKMVTSPTGKGVVLIGGTNRNGNHFCTSGHSEILLELSGHSIENLQWSILDPKLSQPRTHHVAITIPDETFRDLYNRQNF